MTTATDVRPVVTHKTTKTNRQYEVAGAPDTRSARPGSLTVQPVKLVLTFHDGALRWVKVSGPTVRRDGVVGGWKDVGFSGFQYGDPRGGRNYDELPDWVTAFLADEGLEWPGGREPNDALQRLWRLLPGPCPLPDIFGGYSDCAHGSWSDCDQTTAAFLAAGLDPDEERRRILAKARADYIPEEHEHSDGGR